MRLIRKEIRMRINELFYSLQGEGYYTGKAAVFVRLSGCNLRCSFCDTQHDSYKEYTNEDILNEIADYPTRHLIFTGGEPGLQLTEKTVSFFKDHGYYIQVETNGTFELPYGVDWITCSPKFEFCRHAELRLRHIHELKVVYDGNNDMTVYDAIKADHYELQPCDMADKIRNVQIVQQTIDYILFHPQWRLSLQTHKSLNIR